MDVIDLLPSCHYCADIIVVCFNHPQGKIEARSKMLVFLYITIMAVTNKKTWPCSSSVVSTLFCSAWFLWYLYSFKLCYCPFNLWFTAKWTCITVSVYWYGKLRTIANDDNDCTISSWSLSWLKPDSSFIMFLLEFQLIVFNVLLIIVHVGRQAACAYTCTYRLKDLSMQGAGSKKSILVPFTCNYEI